MRSCLVAATVAIAVFTLALANAAAAFATAISDAEHHNLTLANPPSTVLAWSVASALCFVSGVVMLFITIELLQEDAVPLARS